MGASAEAGAVEPRRRRRGARIALIGALAALVLFVFTSYESYSSLYDAEYVGSARCGECHTQVYEKWVGSPHALMTRRATPESVVGDFERHEWRLPVSARKSDADGQPAAIMERRGDEYFMSLWYPPQQRYVALRVDRVVGYQYRQAYLHEEPGGVLRRLPLQWSVERREFFPYWNLQENSEPSFADLWLQTQTQNSAWNLFCARCHTTHLEVLEKNDNHTKAHTRWSEEGIACEACHGPGSAHENYFAGNYVNRIVAFLNSKLRGQPVAYIANAPKLSKGQDLSVCGRCHGPDIMMMNTEVYRQYEPGYSGEGRINDLSDHFYEMPLEPGRSHPATVECWDDGRPKGIAMLFRSFIESSCYKQAEPRCYDCHDPHANKLPSRPGILEPSTVSDAYCLKCHGDLHGRVAEHTHHAPGTPGSFCYDCHMPREIQNLGGGYLKWVRTHTMSSIPRPELTVKHGSKGAPNACNECHTDRDAEWAVQQVKEWWR
jgi:hypothetical protein